MISVDDVSAGSYRQAPAVATMKTLSRSSGAFYLFGAVAALLPAGDDEISGIQRAGIDAIAYIDLAIGLGLFFGGHRLPRRAYHLVIAGGTFLIGAAVVFAKGSVSAEDPIIVFALPIIAAAAFFSWRGAAAHTALVVAAVALTMTYVDADPSRILINVCGFVCIGAGVAWLARLADRIEEDPLTGLGNRRALGRRLEAAVAHAARTGEGFAVVMLDLDHFKSTNDVSGHAAGDDLLVQCAKRWRALVPDERMLCRYGGDEFALLLPGHSLGGATDLAERLRAGLPEGVTASAGVALWERGDSTSMLMSRADVALYDAKANGRDQTAVYGDPSHTAREIELALKAHQLVMHYQPVVALDDGRLVGTEALVRWQHPHRGLLAPAEFIGRAERTGSIHALGSWTLDQACAAAAAGPADLSVAINVSVAELRCTTYAAMVHATLERNGLSARRLVVEVTEGVYDENDEQVRISLTELRSLGVRVALDDFGTGWSSLRWLTTFPVDLIKIDGSFVRTIGAPGKHLEVLSAIVNLAKSLDLKTVAEQVETEAQARILRELGCDCAQGYYFGRPQPLRVAEYA